MGARCLRVLLLWLVLPPLAGAAVHVDDAGRRLELTQPAMRVITLAPNLTELVYAVGAGAAMVGTVDTSDFPEAAAQVPRIGDYQRLDIERILTLKPDLVLAWLNGNPPRELAQLAAVGLRIFYLEPQRLQDVPRALRRVGALLGREQAGEARAAALQRELDALRARYERAQTVSVFYQVWSQPLMTLNDGQLVSDVIALCGGRNIFGDLPQLVPQLSMESVVAANPDAMFTARESAAEGVGLRRDRANATGPTSALAQWRRFSKLTAVRQEWMFSLPGDVISRQGPRIVEGVRAMCSALDEVRQERGRKP